MNPRRRIGLIMPAQDSTSEPDFSMALGLKDYSIHAQRLWDGFDISGASTHGQDEHRDRHCRQVPDPGGSRRCSLLLHHRQLLSGPGLGRRDHPKAGGRIGSSRRCHHSLRCRRPFPHRGQEDIRSHALSTVEQRQAAGIFHGQRASRC